MKSHIVLFFLFLFLENGVNAQGFDSQLEAMATSLAKKIDAIKVGKVAVWGFISENNEQTDFGNFLTDDFSIYLVNHSDTFAIIDRNHLHTLLKEHRLNAEGYIDEKTTKRLGKISAADALVIGTYTIFNSEIRLRVKVLDTETALQFAGGIETLPMNANIAQRLGKL